MKENYVINIEGKIEQAGETDVVSLTTRGRYIHRDGNYYIRYEETEATGYEGNTTTVKVEQDTLVEMRRSGTMPSEIIVERGRRHICHYETPYGAISLGVAADAIENSLSDEGGRLMFSYTLDSDKAHFSHNQVTITVQEVN